MLKLIFLKNSVLGTVGGIAFLKKINSKNFILTNCDTLFKIIYQKLYEAHISNNNQITVVVARKLMNFLMAHVR